MAANRNWPNGARALQNRNGDFPPVKQYDAATGAIYEGQFVILTAAGLASGVTATIGKGQILGVAAAYKAATTTAGAKKVQVYIDPDQLFVMQSDDASLDSRTDYIGRNFNVLDPAAGNATTLQSKMQIDGSTGTTVTTVPVQIVDVYKEIGYKLGTVGTDSSFANFIVRILPAYHKFAGNAGI